MIVCKACDGAHDAARPLCIIQASMVAQLQLEAGGFRYSWFDGASTRRRPAKFKLREQAVADRHKAGFGAYCFEGKTIRLRGAA